MGKFISIICCVNFCLVLLLFLQICGTISSEITGYDSYKSIEHDPDSDVDDLQYDFLPHIVEKREAVQKNDSHPFLAVEAKQKEENVSSLTISTTEKSISKQKSSFTGKPDKYHDPKAFHKGILDDITRNNVGVNGSGQRHNITTKTPNVLTTHLPTLVGDNYDGEFPEDVDVDDDYYVNKTLSEHNITVIKNDTHKYYNSTFITHAEVGKSYWINMDNRGDATVNDLLSNSHRRAATVKLSFEFPFYGHLIKNVTIATGGFLYTGEYVHSWLAATQYIAPLMANFDTSLSNDSYIKYLDNGTAFTVEWNRVRLQDTLVQNPAEFTFQVTLHKNGDILFVYKTVPLSIKDIKNDHHPVKVGLSDAYITDRTVFLVRRKTIYEYHRVNFAKEDFQNWTVIYLKALPTCLSFTNCSGCVTSQLPDFDCVWCPKVNKCSNGYDRNRQDWIDERCDHLNYTKSGEAFCHINMHQYYEKHFDVDTERTLLDHGMDVPKSRYVNKEQPMGASGIMAILFLVVLACSMVFWISYAYRNPHTYSGQMLIRYRPSQWRWRRGEARYSAATIHM